MPDTAPMPDPVNAPAHYTGHPSGVECIEIIEHMSFCLGNALKRSEERRVGKECRL